MPGGILVIEDTPANSELLDVLLRAYGYTPTLTATGEQGLELATAERPDLVLLDLWLPGMNGYEVAAEIRRRPELGHTRIVAVTASAMVGDRERIAAAGFHGYIQKPIEPEMFMAQIARFLPDTPAATDTRAGNR